MNTLKRLFSDERGLETVEYAIIAGLIVVGIVTTVGAIGDWVRDQFQDLESDLNSDGA